MAGRCMGAVHGGWAAGGIIIIQTFHDHVLGQGINVLQVLERLGGWDGEVIEVQVVMPKEKIVLSAQPKGIFPVDVHVAAAGDGEGSVGR